MKPVYIINFKAYAETIGKRGLEIAKTLDKFSKETGANIIIAVQPTDIRLIASEVSIPVWAQHMDPVDPGSKTGHITWEALKEAGAEGTLINHSENRVDHEFINNVVERMSDQGPVVSCARDAEEASQISELEPDYVAMEPPELIGGDVSVSKAKPELIAETVKRSKVPVLVGAGVKTYEDVKKSLELGAEGVLVASGIVKKEDVRGAIEALTGLR